MTTLDTRNYPWLDDYLRALPHVVPDYQADWEAYRYLVGGKMFAMIGCEKAGKPILTVKLEPLEGDLLRQQYPDIIPGYYMNKTHWNSIYLDGDTPDELLREAAEKSRKLIFSSLAKKLQRELEGHEN